MLHRVVSRCLFPHHRYGHYSWHGVMCYLWQGEHCYAGTQTNLLHSLVTYNWPESPHLAQHVPPVVVNIICYQWWDESVVASLRLRLSRHNLIKLLPATPRGISLYRQLRWAWSWRIFLYQYFWASEITRWMFWDIFWPLHHRVQFSVGTECKYYSSS